MNCRFNEKSKALFQEKAQEHIIMISKKRFFNIDHAKKSTNPEEKIEN